MSAKKLKYFLFIILLILLLPVMAGAADYYVNADADAGGDGTTTATTGAQCAWNTIAQVNAKVFTAGDDVYFECGDTWTGTTLTVDWSGTSVNQSIIGAYYGAGTIGVSGARPIIRRADFTGHGVFVDGEDYITFQDIEVARGSRAMWLDNINHWNITNCKIGAGSNWGLEVLGDSTYVKVYRNIVDSEILTYSQVPAGRGGNMYDGINFAGAGGDIQTNIEIYENYVKDWGHDCIYIMRSSSLALPTFNTGTLIYSNYVTSPNSTYCRGFETNGYQTKIYNNYVYQTSIQNQISAQDCEFYNNIIHTVSNDISTGDRGLSFYSSSAFSVTGNKVYNNVFYDINGESVFHAYSNGNEISGNEISNNIILEPGAATLGTKYWTEVADVKSNTFRNNLWYRTGSDVEFQFALGTYASVATWEAGANGSYGNVVSGNLSTDPGLNDPASGEFWAALEGSTVVDAGIASDIAINGLLLASVWDTTDPLTGFAIVTDVRASNNGADIGPYEYAGGGPSPSGNWGITAATTGWAVVDEVYCRCMGGTSSATADLTLGSIEIFNHTTHSSQLRVAVYQGGALDTGPVGATLIAQGSTAGAVTDAYISVAMGNEALASSTVTWICAKGNDAGFGVAYSNYSADAGDFQTATGRFRSANSSDEGVAYAATWPADAGTFNTAWYGYYIIYGGETPASPTITAIGTATVAAGVATFTANRTETETAEGNPGWYYALQLSEQLQVYASPAPAVLRWDCGPATAYADAIYYGHLEDVSHVWYLLFDPNLASPQRITHPQAYGDGSASIIINDSTFKDGDDNALATNFSGLGVDFDGTGEITIAIAKTDWSLTSGGDYATFAAFDTATHSVPDDIFICDFTGDLNTDAAGTSGHVIEFNGAVVGDVTVDQEYVTVEDMTIEGSLNVSVANTTISRVKVSP